MDPKFNEACADKLIANHQMGLVKLIALSAAMCQTFDELGNTSMARISALEFATYYRKRLKRIVKKYNLPFGKNT